MPSSIEISYCKANALENSILTRKNVLAKLIFVVHLLLSMGNVRCNVCTSHEIQFVHFDKKSHMKMLKYIKMYFRHVTKTASKVEEIRDQILHRICMG